MSRRDELRQQRQIHDGDLGVQQIGHETHHEQPARAVFGQFADLERRTTARLHRLPCQIEQIGRPRDPQRIMGEWHSD